MVIKIFFAVLVLSIGAVVAVILAVHLRVKRHLQEEPAMTPALEPELVGSMSGRATKDVVTAVLEPDAAASNGPASSVPSSS